jgi:hypothetical protein
VLRHLGPSTRSLGFTIVEGVRALGLRARAFSLVEGSRALDMRVLALIALGFSVVVCGRLNISMHIMRRGKGDGVCRGAPGDRWGGGSTRGPGGRGERGDLSRR